jgi:regulation of enolase protein 1 (concanavalin A-like superfamily)
MSNTIKASVYDVEISNKSLFLSGKTLDDILKELATKLDDKNFINTRVLDINTNDKETSIWFDSFDDITNFSKEILFDNAVCFLLAKDMNYQFVENKEKKQIENSLHNEKIKPKIPAHCVFIKNKNILLMEETTDAPTVSTFKRGITNNLKYTNDDLSFKAKYRENIVERLQQFVDNIKTIEMIDLNIEKYLKEIEDTDGNLQNFLHNPNTKITAKLQVESNDWKTKVLNLFVDTFNNRLSKEIQNIKVTFKDDKQRDEIITLYQNLVYLKIEKEVYLEDISSLQQVDRLKYSKEIYRTMIEAYNESID